MDEQTIELNNPTPDELMKAVSENTNSKIIVNDRPW